MTLYQDRKLSIDDEGITIASYDVPGHRRRLPFSSIHSFEEIRIGAFSGRYRVMGFELRRPRDFFPWDAGRSKKTRAIALDVGRRVRPVISPDDCAKVVALLTDRLKRTS